MHLPQREPPKAILSVRFPPLSQLKLRSTTKYFSEGSIIADSREAAKGLMVVTSGQVGVELPMDSEEADEENRREDGKTLLYVFSRGCDRATACILTLWLCLIRMWLVVDCRVTGC